jgi:transcriptional regulator with XRE-family HTH domain
MSAAEQIRYHRNLKNISLRSLAKEAGISPSALSKIENGQAKLTVDVAVRIAGILHVPASLFLLEQAPQALARRTITRRGAGVVHKNPGMDLEVLCSDFKEKTNLFWKVKVTAASVSECGGMRRHPGQEFLCVLSGTLEIHTAFYDPCILNTGDSILFDADQPHAYVAPAGPCELIMMNTILPAS